MSTERFVKRGSGPRLLADLVYERLAKALVTGRSRPGARLSVRQLAVEFGVSQMPVRDALKRLAAEGLVRFSPRSGVHVAEISPQELAELFAVRTCLEGYAARLACPRLTPAERRALARLQRAMLALERAPDPGAWLKANEAFHLRVAHAAGNATLERVLREYWNRGKQRRPMATQAPGVRARRNREHARMLAALATGDPALTERVWRQHVDRSGADALRILTAEPGAGDRGPQARPPGGPRRRSRPREREHA